MKIITISLIKLFRLKNCFVVIGGWCGHYSRRDYSLPKYKRGGWAVRCRELIECGKCPKNITKKQCENEGIW